MLRKSCPAVPPHAEHNRLTSMGLEVARQVEGLVDGIEGNLPRIMASRRSRENPAAEAKLAAGA